MNTKIPDVIAYAIILAVGVLCAFIVYNKATHMYEDRISAYNSQAEGYRLEALAIKSNK